MNKTAIRNFAVEARRKLIEDISHKAYEIGITKDEILDIETFEGGFRVKGRENGRTFKKYELDQRDKLIHNIKYKGFEQVIEEVAYTWFNRFIALRFMEVNNYLPTGVRVLSSIEEGKVEPDIIQEALNIDLEVDREIIFRLQDNNDTEDLYKYLLVRQCNQLGKIMPSVFEEIADYTELLLPDKLLVEGSVIRDLVEEVEEYDWKIELNEEEQKQEEEKGEHGIEIIGWLYQYYISEKKDEVFAGLKKNKKITKENIPAATQLFTPKWIVQYMIENSLGRLWLESHPNEELKAQWKYYLEEAEQEPEVQKQLDELKDPNLKPEDIKVLDPAMGSGHILVYAFDLLYEIYLSAGYSEREIPTLILEKNLYGLDIDDRAGQLASFALLMKARSKNRRIFRNKPRMNLCSIQESNDIPKEAIEYFCSADRSLSATENRRGDLWSSVKEDVEYLIKVFHDAKEYGSILEVKEIDFDTLEKRIEEIRNNAPEDIFELQYKEIILEKIPPLIQQARIMSRKYDVVSTNPPYMGRRGMNPKLVKYLDENFKDSKTDLFAVFMELDDIYLKNSGFMGMINQHSWMFLSSYEKLREKMICNRVIYNMIHLGPHAFEEIGGEVVQTTVFVMSKSIVPEYKTIYVRLVEYKNQHVKEGVFLSGENRYVIKKESFREVPGWPIAYWLSPNFFKAFEHTLLKDVYETKKGMFTGDNAYFLKFWFEVCHEKIGIDFLFYNKGGGYRRWFGNSDMVVRWHEKGYEIKNFKGSGNINETYFFKSCLTWNLVSTAPFCGRIIDDGFVMGDAGPICLAYDDEKYYCLAYMNTTVCNFFMNVLNPTMNYPPGFVGNLPFIFDESKKAKVSNLSIKNINISRTDWDSFETSWDFKVHPLANFPAYMDNYYDSLVESGVLVDRENFYIPNLEEEYEHYKEFTNNQFAKLKANEEELNRIFIEIYGLEDELTSEVSDKDITITRIFDTEDEIYDDIKGNRYILTKKDVIKSFISYAVGCIFGRYSLDEEGLIYAGGDFDNRFRMFNEEWEIKTKEGWKQSRVNIAEHNVIPIADGDYFEDDILERFVEFVNVSFGEETLEENLDYIAETLGQRANETSRQAIRRYFLRDFYKDHVRIYKKRPIYWLFDSGRQNGFKALIYMHRYNSFTVARVRTDYLHSLQKKYEAEINHLDILIDSDISNREKAVARKNKETILKQIQECRLYDEAIAHVANQRIGIDLDDGVKVNYAKFQGVQIPQGEGRKPLKADLLAKI